MGLQALGVGWMGKGVAAQMVVGSVWKSLDGRTGGDWGRGGWGGARGAAGRAAGGTPDEKKQEYLKEITVFRYFYFADVPSW